MLGRVAVSNGPKQPFEIREYPVAEPGPDEILVKLTLASVCGSDLHMWRGETPPFQRPPGVPGHEMTGVIAQLGRDRRTDTLGRPLIVPGAATEIVPHDAVRQPKTLLGVLSYDAWVIPRALDWLVRARQRYPFDQLLAARYPLDRLDEAFQQADWAARAGPVPRALITL